VNISRTAKATRFKFIMQINRKEWKISSTKVCQKRLNLGRFDLLLNFGIFFYISVSCIDYSYRLQIQ